MSNRLLILMTLIAVLGTGTAHAACQPPAQPPEIRVLGSVQPPIYNMNYTNAELTRRGASAYSPYSPGSRVIVQGLTQAVVTYKMQAAIQVKGPSDGSANCFYFKSITIDMSSAPTIYVARDIPRNTCLFQEVIKHEMTHYNIIRAVISDYIPVFQQQLNHVVARVPVLGPYHSRSQEQAVRQMKSYIDTVFHGIQPKMGQDMNNRHAQLDTKAEYERVKAACPQDLKYMKHF